MDFRKKRKNIKSKNNLEIKKMTKELTKKDWETTLNKFKELSENADNQIANSNINLELYSYLMPFIEEKIKNFPEEKKEEDPMPEALKEVVSEIVK